MSLALETFIPGLLKTVQRNKGILDIQEAERIYGAPLIKLAIERKIVTRRNIVLNAKLNNRQRIPCITLDWSGDAPIWLTRYKNKGNI